MHQNIASQAATLPAAKHPLGLVGLAGICELLGVSRSSVERLIRNDPLFPKPFKIANRRFVRFEDLQRWIAAKAA
jgi:predicted DNA-binding transcriptional regulator AlpA